MCGQSHHSQAAHPQQSRRNLATFSSFHIISKGRSVTAPAHPARNPFPIKTHACSLSSPVSAHFSFTAKDEAFEKLHDRYAPVMLDIILGMRGFYIKVWAMKVGHQVLHSPSPSFVLLHSLLRPFSLGRWARLAQRGLISCRSSISNGCPRCRATCQRSRSNTSEV